MTDPVDRAQEREEEIRQDAMDKLARRSEAQREKPSANTCRMCGEPIPVDRQIAVPGVETCIECQKDIERLGMWDWGMGEC